uniref:Transposase n=1 Tax=Acrobeloides nanus TaxID=290746 RepID=A0A914E2Z7_9BILA
MTKTVINELQWEVLPHPAYSPDIAPSNFHLFHSLSSALSFDTEEELSDWLDNWFSSKDKAFYRRGIEKLPELWKKIIDCDGEYITE